MAEDGWGQQMGHGQDSEGSRLSKFVFLFRKNPKQRRLWVTPFLPYLLLQHLQSIERRRVSSNKVSGFQKSLFYHMCLEFEWTRPFLSNFHEWGTFDLGNLLAKTCYAHPSHLWYVTSKTIHIRGTWTDLINSLNILFGTQNLPDHKICFDLWARGEWCTGVFSSSLVPD